MPRRGIRLSLVALTTATALTFTGGLAATAPATGDPGERGSGEPTMLGLPPLSEAQQYVLAPSSRTVRPMRLQQASQVNHDFVTAASQTSEVSAHDLRAGTSSVARVGGYPVRRAGVGVDGGNFSYTLRVPRNRSFELRVEEAGSANASYDVRVNGQRVHTRSLDLYAAQGRPIGLTHYSVTVPAQLVTTDRAEVSFVNSEVPGDGAQIHAVWANVPNGARNPKDLNLPAYGGIVRQPDNAMGKGSTRLASDFFGRPYAIYDFGREVGGTIQLHVDGVEGNPRLGLAFSESDTFLTTASDYSQDPSGIATETHFFPVTETGTLSDPVIRGGFRYLMVFLDTPGTVDLSRLQLNFTADPGNPDLDSYAGAFLSSDETLNELWYAGAYTTQMATIPSDTGRPYPATPGPVRNDVVVAAGEEFLSDGAKRDRYDWGGDNVVSNTVAYLTTGRSLPAQNALDWFAANPSPEGQVPGVYLPEPNGFNFSWGEYAAWWSQNYWVHYLYTGDRAYLDKWFTTLADNVAWFESRVGADGLWDVPPGAGGHWGYGQSGKEAYDNLVYVHSLTSAIAAAEEMGRGDLATQWRAQAERTGAAVNATLWDEEAGAYREIAGSQAHPLDANSMAIITGVAGPERAQRILDFFESELRTPYGEVAVEDQTGSGGAPLHQPVRGQPRAARPTPPPATTPGRWTCCGAPGNTCWRATPRALSGRRFLRTAASASAPTRRCSHGWAAAPTNFLTHETLGVQPTGPGFATFDVAPQPGDLAWAQGAVPTPHGTIRTAWKLEGDGFLLTVEAPPGTTYTATVPVAAAQVVTVDGDPVDAEPSGGEVRLDGLTSTSTVRVTPNQPRS